MYTVITVVFTTKPFTEEEINGKKEYEYICNDSVKIGDIITGRCGEVVYGTPMQIVNIKKSSTRSVYNVDGKRITLKELSVVANPPKIQSKNDELPYEVPTTKSESNNFKEMKKISLFAGIADKFRSQYSPVLEDGVKMSSDGTVCVAIGGEYIGMKPDGALTSYPHQMLINIPVYSINKPSDQVQIGEIIKTGNQYGRVMMRNPNGSFKIQSYDGYTQDKYEVQDFLLGQSMTRVLINVYSFEANGFNPVLFALADESNDFGVDDLFMLSMTDKGKELLGKTGLNPAMLMMLASKDEDKNFGNNMMSMFLMSQMFGNGQNPFQFNPVQTAPVQHTTSAEDVINTLKSNPDLLKQIKDLLA
jgi:hypothetical protein